MWHICAQTACALQFLHERNISHLDLKPQNILLSGSVLKLAGDLILTQKLNTNPCEFTTQTINRSYPLQKHVDSLIIFTIMQVKTTNLGVFCWDFKE